MCDESKTELRTVTYNDRREVSRIYGYFLKTGSSFKCRKMHWVVDVTQPLSKFSSNKSTLCHYQWVTIDKNIDATLQKSWISSHAFFFMKNIWTHDILQNLSVGLNSVWMKILTSDSKLSLKKLKQSEKTVTF